MPNLPLESKPELTTEKPEIETKPEIEAKPEIEEISIKDTPKNDILNQFRQYESSSDDEDEPVKKDLE